MDPEPAIRINVDPSNPGQFFACCGLLELADRLWPGAEGWFEDRWFFIDCEGSLRALLDRLIGATLNSSLTDQELKRLGTLLSANKATLGPSDAAEKQRLSDSWRREHLHLSEPFDLRLDWWRDEYTGAKALKTWAAKQFVLEIARPLLRALRNMSWRDCSLDACLSRAAEIREVPFYFDSENNSQGTPRDVGFGLYTLRNRMATRGGTRPLLELAAFFGLQRFRPKVVADRRLIYSTWRSRLPASVAAVAAAGLLEHARFAPYAFSMLKRTEYMKAFLPAQPYRGS